MDQSFVASFLWEVRLRAIGTHDDEQRVREFMTLLDFEKDLDVLRIKEEQTIHRYSSYDTSLIIPSYYDYAMKIMLKGTFQEEFELRAFPFDTQDLNIVVTCNRPYIIDFHPNQKYPSLFIFQDISN
jgi:hypothetical protein